jgi:hypothetical protein
MQKKPARGPYNFLFDLNDWHQPRESIFALFPSEKAAGAHARKLNSNIPLEGVAAVQRARR